VEFITRAWYEKKKWILIFYPLSVLYRFLSSVRKNQYLSGSKPVWHAPVPVIIVGNISIGGSGKTPLALTLIKHLKNKGYNPGIVSRGYGAATRDFPRAVNATDNPVEVGDEPLLLAQRGDCPVVIDPDRVSAAKFLLEQFDCDIIISDDGMQHYALGRDIEIAVVDAARRFGNELCLPAGPLREPVKRLDQVDFIVYNGELPTKEFSNQSQSFSMQLVPDQFVPLSGEIPVAMDSWSESTTVEAVAGIGNPTRFFSTLRTLGFSVNENPFPDHHQFSASDFSEFSNSPTIMTEKDAVKCEHSWIKNGWFLQVTGQLDDLFFSQLDTKIEELSKNL